jgi:hypothetical protein
MVEELSWRLHGEVESLLYVGWTQSEAGAATVEWQVDGGAWQSRAVAGVEGEQEELLLGIPFEAEVEWRISLGDSTVEGATAETGDVPNGLPEPHLEVASPEAWLPGGNFLLTSLNERDGGWTGGTYWTVIIDRDGRYVWARKTGASNWTLFTQVAQSGDHLLIDEATYWDDFDGGAGSVVTRTYLDREIEKLSTPGLHHAFVQLPDGTLAWGSQHHGGGESLVEMAPGSSEVNILWQCRDTWGGGGRCESNGLHYSPDRDTYLYSFYTNETVIELARATAEPLWWAGRQSGGIGFEPIESQYCWQHGVSWTAAGTFLVSTHAKANGSSSCVGGGGGGGGGGSTTLVREYTVDPKVGLTEIWSYDAGSTAETNGDAWRLDNGNTLHVVGSAGQVKEVDAAGTTVWHIDLRDDYLMGRGEWIEDLHTLVAPPD